jgi:hypothetical protein
MPVNLHAHRDKFGGVTGRWGESMLCEWSNRPLAADMYWGGIHSVYFTRAVIESIATLQLKKHRDKTMLVKQMLPGMLGSLMPYWF